jgi:hypothetical protein
MSEAQIHATLRRIFDVVVREAEHNPALAQKLVQAIAEDVPAETGSARRTRGKPFDASPFHAVNILRLHGESALRGKLEQVKAVADLKSVARLSGLVLAGGARKARPSRAELISEIVAAAKHYDAQRNAATA